MPSGNILIVDDEPNLRHTLARILRQAGCEVVSAADGYEAMRMLSAGMYDLVYMDIRMPGLDGLQVLSDIRLQYPHLPVILLTAYGSLQTAVEALRLGAIDYLLKPVDPEVLVARTRIAIKEQIINRRKRELQEQIARLQNELQLLESSYPESVQTNGAALQGPEERFLKCGALVLDLQARRATLHTAVIALPPASFDYLVVLARHSPDAVDYTTLVTEAQGYQVDASEARELAKYHIHVLRQAIEDDPRNPQHVHNVRGTGYRLLGD